MTKFQFRLATVLRVARIREQRDQHRLVLEQIAARQAEQLERERAAAYAARPDLAAGETVDVADALTRRATGELRARAMVDATEGREAAYQSVAEARTAYLDAARRVKSIEELEERHYAAHAATAARAAQRALEDVVRVRRERSR